MREQKIKLLNKGIYNALDAEDIPVTAASDAKNFVSKKNGLELVRGKEIVGDLATGSGGVTSLHVGHTATGTAVIFRKISTKIQYLNGSTWTDLITGLTAGSEYTFTDVSTLAGDFVVATGADGIYKIPTANPASYRDLYDETKNQLGKSLFDGGRLLMWDVTKDKTGLYLSHIDEANYTTVSSEAIGAAGSTDYSGTLTAASSTRTLFGVTFTDGTETFTDNLDGTLTGSAGGTGTVNYVTGAYAITFNAVTGGSVTADYQWEDSNNGGIGDFTYSATRVAGEGDVFRQDIGGDAILNVIPLEGSYFSFKKKSVYQLTLSDDDTTATNKVFRRNVGIPNWQAVVPTSTGIVFINTANPDGTRLEILQRNLTGDSFDSVELAPQFNWGLYNYDDAVLDVYGDYVVIACKTNSEAITDNNRIILVNLKLSPVAVDVTNYFAESFAVDGNIFYSGDSLSDNVYKLFTGFDDDGDIIDAYFISHKDTLGTERLKRIRRQRWRGAIALDQGAEVYESYDDSAFELIATISGRGDYVDQGSPESVGSSMVGSVGVGGDADGEDVYTFLLEMKSRTPKFRQRRIKIVPTGVGYFRVNHVHDVDVLLYDQKLPKKYRG